MQSAHLRAVTTSAAPRPGGAYSQAIAAGTILFVAGQVPKRPADETIPSDFESQAHQALQNLAAVLHEAGGTLRDVVRVGVYLNSLDDFPTMDRIYREYFTTPHPARTTVGVTLRGFLLEVDAVAVLGSAQ